MRSHFSLSGIWHLALASGIWYMIYAFTSLSHFEHVHIYWHVHMFTCSHFYHIWKCERRYMRSHSWVKVVEPNGFSQSSTFFPLSLSSPLNIEHLNIWTFKHLNIWTLEHLDMLISAAFNILYAVTFLSGIWHLASGVWRMIYDICVHILNMFTYIYMFTCSHVHISITFENVNADICGHILESRW